MRIGYVGTGGDARVRVSVRAEDGHEQGIEAVLDTGFNGFLALPVATIEALNLDPLGSEERFLATGERRRVPPCDATVGLGTLQRRAEGVEAGEPLVGTALVRVGGIAVVVPLRVFAHVCTRTIYTVAAGLSGGRRPYGNRPGPFRSRVHRGGLAWM